MALSSGVKFRCYPTEEQQKILSQWMGCQRFIYNAKVSEDRYFRTFRNHSLSLTGIQTPVDQQYAQFKSTELTPFPCDKENRDQDAFRWRNFSKAKEACHAVKEKASPRPGTGRSNARGEGDKTY